MLRMHELRIQSNLRSLFNSMHSPRTISVWRKLYCCKQLKPSVWLFEEKKVLGFEHNLVCKIAVSIETAIHTTFHPKFNVKCFFHFVVGGDDAKFNNRLKWKLFFPRSNDTIRITSSIHDEKCVHKCFQRIKCTIEIHLQCKPNFLLFDILCAVTFSCSKLLKHSFESGQNGFSESKTAVESRKKKFQISWLELDRINSDIQSFYFD